MEVIHVTPGLRHRLRFVGATGLNCPVVVSLDGHQMTLIATDGTPIVPFTMDSFVIYTGKSRLEGLHTHHTLCSL